MTISSTAAVQHRRFGVCGGTTFPSGSRRRFAADATKARSLGAPNQRPSGKSGGGGSHRRRCSRRRRRSGVDDGLRDLWLGVSEWKPSADQSRPVDGRPVPTSWPAALATTRPGGCDHGLWNDLTSLVSSLINLRIACCEGKGSFINKFNNS